MAEDQTTAAQQPSNLEEVGEVEKDVLSSINAMRARAASIVTEIGQMEIRKVGLVHELNRLESQCTSLLRTEAQRLGIPEGSPWQLTPQGKALVQKI